MIYLLRKHDIQSFRVCMIGYPFHHTPKAYITPAVDIMPKVYHPFRQERISLKEG